MKKELFDELLGSLKDGGKILNGKAHPSRAFQFKEPEIQKLRIKYGLSQNNFANLIGISVGTLRNWEQGRRKPEGPARVLLSIVDRHPEAILDSLVAKRKAA